MIYIVLLLNCNDKSRLYYSKINMPSRSKLVC